MPSVLVLTALVILQFCEVRGHGRLIEPAARNAMWRFKYKNPRNYNDMGLNCGGFTTQFEKYGGKCGVCGDPWDGEREHEAGGKYANGIVARQYQVGSFINVTVTLTSNHMGYFEFRLCPVNNPRKRATHACLDRYLLNIAGHGTRYFIMDKRGYLNVQMFVMLPPNLSCSQCVLQWKWVAGQSMGSDGMGGECLGCGNQENFVNCADIAIGDRMVAPLPQPVSTPRPPTTTPPPTHNHHQQHQIMYAGKLPTGAIPTIHASYGAYNHAAPQGSVAYNVIPMPQPPTAHSTHSQVHMQHGQVQSWGGNQQSMHSSAYQPAQVSYTTIQETPPKATKNVQSKVQIIKKPNPYANNKAMPKSTSQAHPQPHASHIQQSQKSHFSPQPPARPAAPAHTYQQAQMINHSPNNHAAQYQQHSSHAPQASNYHQPNRQLTAHTNSNNNYRSSNNHFVQPSGHIPQPNAHVHAPQPNRHIQQQRSHLHTAHNVPQHHTMHTSRPNIHVPTVGGSAQHVGNLQAVSYVPHANNHAIQTPGHTQTNNNAVQQQAYMPQNPVYPQHNNHVHSQQHVPQTYQQTHNPAAQATPHLQSKAYVPTAPLPQAQPTANVASHSKTSNPMQFDMNSLKKMFPQFAENFEFLNEIATPPNQRPTVDPSQGSYAGYEPGEYPEPGESPSPQKSGSSEQPSSYMQGYNDALREMKRQFGISGHTGNAGSSSAGNRCPGGVKPTCKGINEWQGQSQFDTWCTTTCATSECPANFCSCTCPGAGSFKSGMQCRGVDPAKGSSMDEWCTLNCKGGHCPPDLCACL